MKKLLNKSIILTLSFLLMPVSVEAVISYVDSSSCTATANNGADATLTFPSLLEGDLVIIGHQIPDDDSNHDLTLSDMTDWNEVADLYANDSDDAQLAVYWKVMGATPDASATLVGAGASHTDTDTSGVCMVFRGVDTTTPMDVTPTNATGINTMHPNPPSIDHNNPSGVWTVIIGANAETLGTTGSYTFPTGYTTNTVEDRASDSTDGTVGISYNNSPSDPEDPDTMTHSGTDSTARSWAAVTMALRPAVVAIDPPTVTTNTETNVSNTRAIINGEITDTGGENSTARGFAWGTSSTLSGGDTSTTTESGDFGTGTFSQNVSNLVSNTTYYFRAYATNPTGTGYGNIDNFVTTEEGSPSRMMRLFEGFLLKIFEGSRFRLFGL